MPALPSSLLALPGTAPWHRAAASGCEAGQMCCPPPPPPSSPLAPGDTLSPGVNQCCCWVAREGAANVRFKGMGLLVAPGGLCPERKGPREAKPHLYTPGEQLHE